MKERTKNIGKKETAKNKTRKDGKPAHCFGCGATDDEVANCTHKEKGPKCFRCNEFGHISAKCTKLIETKRNKEVNIVRMTDVKTVPVTLMEIILKHY